MNSVTRTAFTMQLHCGKTVDACHRRRRSGRRRIGMQFRKCATWFHSSAVAAASCGFKIPLTGTNVGDRRMTTIRLINAGGSAASVSHDDRTGSACWAKKKKEESRAVFMYAGSTVYSAHSENERKGRKK